MSMAAVPTRPVSRESASFDPVAWFYPLAGLVLLAGTVWGFQHFYFHGRSYPGRPITPPIRTLIILHGIAMSAWIVLFATQPWLVALRRKKLHMTVGRLGVALAAAVLVLGVMVGVQSARVTPPDMKLWGLTPKPFMAVPLISVLAFGVLVSIGLWNRRRPAVHRAMMFSGTLAVMPAAISRIDPLNSLYLGTVWERVFGPFLMTAVVGLALLALRCLIKRSIDRWLALGVAFQIGLAASIMALAPTRAWDAVASLLVK